MRTDRLIVDLVFLLLVVACGLALVVKVGRRGETSAFRRLETRLAEAEARLGAQGAEDVEGRIGRLEKRVAAISQRVAKEERKRERTAEAARRAEAAAAARAGAPAPEMRHAVIRVEEILRGAFERYVRESIRSAVESGRIDPENVEAIVAAYLEERRDLDRLRRNAAARGLSESGVRSEVEALRERRVATVTGLLGEGGFEATAGVLPEPSAYRLPLVFEVEPSGSGR